MSNQLSGKFVNVGTFEVVELLSREIEDSRATDDRYVDATAVEYFSVHDWPPIVACEGRQMLRLLVYDSEENRPYRSDIPLSEMRRHGQSLDQGLSCATQMEAAIRTLKISALLDLAQYGTLLPALN